MKTHVSKPLNIIANIFLFGVMAFYCFILFGLLFGKQSIGSFRSVNLIPFQEIGAYLFGNEVARRAFGLSNILGNIILFIPLGIYISLINRKGKIFFNTILVMLFSIAAEIIQYVLKVGASDIDDVILNTAGGFLGAVIFYILGLLFKNNVKKAVSLLALAGCITTVVYLFTINQP